MKIGQAVITKTQLSEKKNVKYLTYVDKISDEIIQDNYQVNCVIAEETKSGSRRFFICSYEEFFRLWEEIPIYSHFFHEACLNIKNCRVAFDIEADKSVNMDKIPSEDYFINEIIIKLIETAVYYLNRILNGYTMVCKEDFIILLACSKEKYSAHVICGNDNVYMKNTEHLKQLTMDIFNYCLSQNENFRIRSEKYGFKSIIDYSLGCFLRLFKSGKRKEEKRVFQCYSIVCQSTSPFYPVDILKKTMLTYYITDYYSIEYIAFTNSIDLDAKLNEQPNNFKFNTKNIRYTPRNDIKSYRYDTPFTQEEEFAYYPGLITLAKRYYLSCLNRNIDIKIKKLIWNTNKSRILITLINTPCTILHKTSKQEHKTLSGISLVLTLDKRYMFAKCQSAKCKDKDRFTIQFTEENMKILPK
jgi:hypothetical protein